MDNGRQCTGKYFRTGARSGMKRSPRTSTSLEAIVALYFYHWLLQARGVGYIRADHFLNSTRPHAKFRIAAVLGYTLVFRAYCFFSKS